jgi:Bacterial Ig-like domain (group 3)
VFNRRFKLAVLKVTIAMSAVVLATDPHPGAIAQQLASSTKLAVSPSPAPSTDTITVTATVASADPAGGTPTGMVEFFDATTRLGSASLVDENGTLTAAINVSQLAVGPHPITAKYTGDAVFDGSVSPIVQHESR